MESHRAAVDDSFLLAQQQHGATKISQNLAATLTPFGFVVGGNECRRGFRNGLAVYFTKYLVAPELGIQLHLSRNRYTRGHHERPLIATTS